MVSFLPKDIEGVSTGWENDNTGVAGIKPDDELIAGAINRHSEKGPVE